jgi:hypothetical protein
VSLEGSVAQDVIAGLSQVLTASGCALVLSGARVFFDAYFCSSRGEGFFGAIRIALQLEGVTCR